VVKTRNDLGQGLANGDTGVVVRIDGDLVFAFRHADSVVTVPVSVDDAVQLAFATTVHKAQGSEYAHVVVVAPPRGSALATRELLYTAMTRAKPHAVIIGTTEDLAHAIDTRQTRSSGLADRLSTS
jgi:exodeoxyribonuclease V alpha subunit